MAAILAAVVAGACRDADPAAAGSSSSPRPVVVVSVPPLAWFVDEVAQGGVEVAVMVPPGASPATYEPSATQMRTVAAARLYVAVGHPRFPFETAWLPRLSESNPEMRVVRAGAGCRHLPADPHLWLSTACARRMAAAVGEALAPVLGAERRTVRRRVERTVGRVDSVEAEVTRRLAPHRGRSFLVFHPALGYLARDHGLRQMAIQRGASEPAPGELSEIIRRAREERIRTVFVQPQFSRQAARLVAEELEEGRVETVNPLAAHWPSGVTGIARKLAASFRRSSPPPGGGDAAVAGAGTP